MMTLPRSLARLTIIALAAAGCATEVPRASAPAVKPAAAAAAAGSARSILWVGNSFFYYNNSMHGHVRNLAQGMSPRVDVRGVSLTISGSGIDWHDLQSYLRPDGIGRYSFVGDNEIRFNPPGRQFDAVMMMDCSQCPVHPQLSKVFFEHVKKNAEIVRKHGAQPVLFMSWAYKDKPEMTQQLAEAYVKAGRENGAQVVPAGLAFARAIAGRPGLELYVPDKRHPSLEGTYLAAATVFAAMTGQSPIASTYTAGLEAGLARYLRETAWQTVQAFGK
jgi:hypothetical protein